MLGYRTILTTENTAANLEQVLGILKRWAEKKKRFPSLPTNGRVESRYGSVITASSYMLDASVGFRWELVEQWDPPRRNDLESSSREAVTHITLVSGEGRLWFWVDVQPPTLTIRLASGRVREDPQYTATPGFVTDIIEAVEMQDGLAEPLTGFQAVPKASYVAQVLRVVQDDTRMGAVFVTSPPSGTSVDEWVEASDERSYAMQGLGVGFVLSPEALEAFNQETEPGHAVLPGSMRTFVPGARLRDPSDSVNHRLMLASTLRDSDTHRVRRILRSAQIRRMHSARLPAPLRDADYEFLRRRRMQPFEVLHREDAVPATETSPVPVLPDADKLLQRLAEAEQLALEAVDENLGAARERDEAVLGAELAQAEADEFYARFSKESREVERLGRQVAYLRNELVALGGAATAWADAPGVSTDQYPETFEELIGRLGDIASEGELPHVRFSGDREEAIDLDGHTGLGTAAVTKVWDALLTFEAYCATRIEGRFDGSLQNYAQSSVHGGLVRLGSVGWSESESVRKSKKWSAQRLLPVSTDVDPSGFVHMWAHVKLSNLTGVAPRMYFEDTYSSVGYVTVGYLGSHMDNGSTN